MVYNRISRRGDFSCFFNKDLLGLVYMAPLNVQVNTNNNKVLNETSFTNYRRQLLAKEQETIGGFVLSDYLNIELQRGDEYSAEAKDLNFEVSVKQTVND